MAILSTVESMLTPDDPYETRKLWVAQVTELYRGCINRHFSPELDTQHRTLQGFVMNDRARVFDTRKFGLQGLVSEIGELEAKPVPCRHSITFVNSCN